MKPANIWSAVFLVFALLAAESASAIEGPIDINKSVFRIHVMKAGLFSAAGHEYWVTAPIAQGSLDDGESSHIALTFDARKWTVDWTMLLVPSNKLKCSRPCRRKRLRVRGVPRSASAQPRS